MNGDELKELQQQFALINQGQDHIKGEITELKQEFIRFEQKFDERCDHDDLIFKTHDVLLAVHQEKLDSNDRAWDKLWKVMIGLITTVLAVAGTVVTAFIRN